METIDEALVRSTFGRLLQDRPASEILATLIDSGVEELCREMPAVTWSALFSEQGERCIASPALDLVLLQALGLPFDSGRMVLPKLNPGADTPACWFGSAVQIEGIVLSGVQSTDPLLVVSQDRIAVIAGEAPGLIRRVVRGFDPALELTMISGQVDSPTSLPLKTTWEAVVAGARRVLAQELLGLGSTMLARTVTHVSSREQFGRPLAVFQSVKHRLADVHVAIAAGESALRAAWTDDDPFLATLAKAQSGKAALLAARHSLQLSGGLGFTWEFGLHQYIRRARVIDALFGSCESLQREIGATCFERGEAPRVFELS